MEDGQILQEVKAILVRNGFDTQFLNIDVTNKAVFIKGIVTVHIYKAGPKSKSPESVAKLRDEVKKALRALETQIHQMAEIKSVFFEFDNWQKTSAGWMEKKV